MRHRIHSAHTVHNFCGSKSKVTPLSTYRTQSRYICKNLIGCAQPTQRHQMLFAHRDCVQTTKIIKWEFGEQWQVIIAAVTTILFPGKIFIFPSDSLTAAAKFGVSSIWIWLIRSTVAVHGRLQAIVSRYDRCNPSSEMSLVIYN